MNRHHFETEHQASGPVEPGSGLEYHLFRVSRTRLGSNDLASEYLVTGATGLLGNNIVRQLHEQGHRVRVLVRAAPPIASLADLDVEIVTGDVTDANAVQRAARGVRYVIHAAGDLHIGQLHLERQRRVNVHGTANVAQAARLFGARLVHVSSVDALPASHDGTPVNEETRGQPKDHNTYVQTKREADEAVDQEQQQGLDAVIVHPGFMLGPWDWKPSSGRMLLSVARHWKPAAPTGGMSGCDVREVARATLTAATRAPAGRHYILAGENLSYLAAWKLFARVAGRPGPLIPAGPLVRIVAGRSGDLWGRLTGNEPDVNSAMIRMSRLQHYYSSQRAVDELDYRIAPFEDAVRTAWRWFRERGYK
jgi:dihydroflavonol-4-reductase